MSLDVHSGDLWGLGIGATEHYHMACTPSDSPHGVDVVFQPQQAAEHHTAACSLPPGRMGEKIQKVKVWKHMG